MTFTAGDTVQPKPGFDIVEFERKVPSGVVISTLPFGRNGQVVFIGTERKPFYAGYFEKVES